MSDFPSLVGAPLAAAMEAKGFTALTAVQRAVLEAPPDRDLRITSQTGSGKTVAIGLALRTTIEALEGAALAENGVSRPRALVIAPTRELAKQVLDELSWLFAPLRATVASTTGGASFRDERRALSRGPAIVVGTPGRLLDHLRRRSIDASEVAVVVIDEADRMLDLGFRDELESILELPPEGHRTHLVSATFPREVRALADAVQDDPSHVEGTQLGVANVDIDHVVHLVEAKQRVDAIVNLLLVDPEAQTLVFARTRAEVAQIATELQEAGFAVRSLSGEMEQRERDRALAAFRRGELHVLVATDVAARGIDVQDITRVIHAEPPTDADAYTHRSGRTGRAGRKGTSSVLVSPSGLEKATRILRRAGVKFRFEPIPTADSIRRAAGEQLIAALSADEGPAVDAITQALADRLAARDDAARTIARLLLRARTAGPAQPRDVRPIEPPRDAHLPKKQGPPGSRGREQGEARAHGQARGRAQAQAQGQAHARARAHGQAPTQTPTQTQPQTQAHAHTPPPRGESRRWTRFHLTWGEETGADPRRLLAVVCRRGGIRGSDVGAIRIGRRSSTVEVAADVAEKFARAASRVDPRAPEVSIRHDRLEGRLEGGDAPVQRPQKWKPSR